jgi:hypothetical protein
VAADHNFYVYILYRADGETPFYVGKGRSDRWLEHEKDAKREHSYKAAIIRQMQADGIAVPKRKVADGLSNAEACALEIKLIAQIGRYPKGPLANLTVGGEGVVDLPPDIREKHRRNTSAAQMGRKVSDATRAAISRAQIGMKRGQLCKEQKTKISNSVREAWKRVPLEMRGVRGMYGKRHSAKTKAKMRAAAMGRVISLEQRALISKRHKGRVQSLEERTTRSEAQSKRWAAASPEAHKRQSEMMKRVRASTTPATLLKMSLAHLGNKPSAETRMRMSVARRRYLSREM